MKFHKISRFSGFLGSLDTTFYLIAIIFMSFYLFLVTQPSGTRPLPTPTAHDFLKVSERSL